MILLDANVLLYAYDSLSPFQPKLARWLDMELAGEERIAIPWVTIWAFVRVRTNPVTVSTPSTPEECFGLVRQWLEHPNVVQADPGLKHTEILERLMSRYGIRGPKTSDAVLAALALEHGAAVASTDHDFSRFEQIRWINPLKVA